MRPVIEQSPPTAEDLARAKEAFIRENSPIVRREKRWAAFSLAMLLLAIIGIISVLPWYVERQLYTHFFLIGMVSLVILFVCSLSKAELFRIADERMIATDLDFEYAPKDHCLELKELMDHAPVRDYLRQVVEQGRSLTIGELRDLRVWARGRSLEEKESDIESAALKFYGVNIANRLR